MAWTATEGHLDVADASTIKVFGTEFYLEAFRLLMEILGPRAYLDRDSVGSILQGRLEMNYRSLLILTFGGGTNEIQRDLIGMFGLGLPRALRELTGERDMDFRLDEAQQAIGDLANQVLGDRSTHERLRELETSDAPRFDRDLWKELADLGILGASLPEAHGGAGLDLVALGGVLEAAGRTAAAVPLWETLGLGALPIAEFAPEALASEILPAVAAGDLVLTAAWHEDGGEPLAPTTVATRTDGSWSVTGTKICVPGRRDRRRRGGPGRHRGWLGRPVPGAHRR